MDSSSSFPILLLLVGVLSLGFLGKCMFDERNDCKPTASGFLKWILGGLKDIVKKEVVDKTKETK